MGRKKEQGVTQSDIARELNISVVSVSNALNGKKGIGDEMRQKILDTAEELGYRGRMPLDDRHAPMKLGVLIAKRYLQYTPSFYMKVYQEIVLAATDRKCVTMLEVLDEEMEQHGQVPQMLIQRRVDGALVLGELSMDYTRAMKEHSRVPVIFVDYYVDLPETDFIISDGYRGTCRLTRRLIEAGMQKIAFVGTPGATSSIMDRYLGYRKAMMERYLPIRQEWVIPDRDEHGVLQVDLPEEMPQAFVCNCDKVASLVISRLRERGLRVPQDVAVTGFDHYLMDDIGDLELTTYVVDFRGMAQVGVNTLLRKITHLHFIPRLRVINGEIHEGNSDLREEV